MAHVKSANVSKSALDWETELPDADKARYNRMARWAAAAYCKEESLLSWTCGPRCQGNI